MTRILLTLLLTMFLLFPELTPAAHFQVQKVTDGIYAAIAQPGGKAVSNAMFVVTNFEVILMGAHFVPEVIKELTEEVAEITPLPISHVILTHHHKGFGYVDFELPPKAEVVASEETWQALKSEHREMKHPATVFETTLVFQREPFTLQLSSMGGGHSTGDTVVYLPRERLLFASDLFFNEMVGYMGEASVLEWGAALEALEALEARTVVPGLGKVTDGAGLTRFRTFYRDFMTEVMRYVEKGQTLAQTKKKFSLEKYHSLPGYRAFLDTNLERAYKQLKLQLND
jgi:glyoxylase-like metal-dependent hydrolase (beta-lactamase superfamily II)